jgi:hypothetical protein
MKVHKQKHNPALVTAFFASYGIPKPEFEHRFHPTRKWRFDMCWDLDREIQMGDSVVLGLHVETGRYVKCMVYLEVQGGIWIKGGHNRGAQMKKDWEKANEASALGWRGIWVEPKDLLTKQTADVIRRCLCLG